MEESVDDEDESKTAADLCRRLRYYFSDYNICTNGFMRDLNAKNKGWVRFGTLMTFNGVRALVGADRQRLCRLMAALPTQPSDVYEVDTEAMTVRRRADLPVPTDAQAVIADHNSRTVHLKGFPVDSREEDVIAWLKTYGPIEHLDIRRKNTTGKPLKGCLFVTYRCREVAERLLREPTTSYEGQALLKEDKGRYHERKREFVAKVRTWKSAHREAKAEVDVGTDAGAGQAPMDVESAEKSVYIPKQSSVLELKELPRDMAYQAIADWFKGKATVVYVLRMPARDRCCVRIKGQPDADKVLTAIRTSSAAPVDENSSGISDDFVPVIVDNQPCVGRVLAGDQLTDFWRRNNERMAKLRERTEQKAKWDRQMVAAGTPGLTKRQVEWINNKVDEWKAEPVREPGAVMILSSGCGGDGGTDRTDQIREYFKRYGSVLAVDRRPNGYYYVRFEHRYTARNVLAVVPKAGELGVPDPLSVPLAATDGKPDERPIVIHKIWVAGHEMMARELSGKPEEEYWLTSIDAIERKRLTKQMMKNARSRAAKLGKPLVVTLSKKKRKGRPRR